MISEINGVRNYKASRRAMSVLYSVFAGIFLLWTIAIVVSYVSYGQITITDISTEVLFLALFSVGILPKFFRRNHLSVSEHDIVCVKGIITDRKVYLPMDAVKSVTMILTPLGDMTGINAIVFNALGSRLTVLFLDRADCIDIYSFVNGIIMARGSENLQD